jgi:hypothetical protein
MSINKKISRKTSSKNKRSINRKTKRQLKRRGGLGFNKKTMDEALVNTKYCYPTWYINSNDGKYKQGTLGVPVGVDKIAIEKNELLEELKKKGFENVNQDDINLLPSLKPVTFNGKQLSFNGNNIEQLAYIPNTSTWGDKSERVCYNKDLSLDDWNKLYPKKEEGQEDIKEKNRVSQPEPPKESTFVPATNIKELKSEINDKENNDKENNDNKNNDIGEIQSFDDSGSSSGDTDEEQQGGRRKTKISRKKTKRRKSKKTKRRKSRKTRRKPRVLRRMKRRI